MDDIQLIKKVKRQKCSQSVIELRNRHIGLIVSQYGRYNSILDSLHFKPADFNDEINYIVYDSARKFDLRRKKIKFSTWLCECTKYFCLNKITELNKKKTVEAEPDTITKLIDECYKNDDSNQNKQLCNYIYSILEQMDDKRIIEIFNMRYFQSKNHKNKSTWQDIARSLKPSMSSQGVINLHEKALKLLKTKLNSNNLQDRI